MQTHESFGGALALLLKAAESKAPHPGGERIKIHVRSGAGRVLHRHMPATNQWDLPGGEVGGDESPQEAASRHLLEHTGYKIAPSDFMVEKGEEGEGATTYTVSAHASSGRQHGKPMGEIMWIKPAEEQAEKHASAVTEYFRMAGVFR